MEEGKTPKKKRTPSQIHQGHRDRLRGKYIENGLESFSDHEALELLLFYGIPRQDVNTLAHRMIEDDFKSIVSLLEASPEVISHTCGLSMNTAVLISLILPLYKRYETAKWSGGVFLNSSKDACDYAKGLFIGATDEIMYMICLDSKNRVIYTVEIARGTIDKAPVYPRVIISKVLNYNAASIILAHNHPSGSVIPSHSDLQATTYIRDILEKIEVKVTDHIIVGGSSELSFAEKNILHFK
jgi:DNA repair protein RadC